MGPPSFGGILPRSLVTIHPRCFLPGRLSNTELDLTQDSGLAPAITGDQAPPRPPGGSVLRARESPASTGAAEWLGPGRTTEPLPASTRSLVSTPAAVNHCGGGTSGLPTRHFRPEPEAALQQGPPPGSLGCRGQVSVGAAEEPRVRAFLAARGQWSPCRAFGLSFLS